MSKLFAFENADVVGDEVELETPVEAGEVANAELEVQEEVGELESQETAIDEGTEAADQLEEVEALVEQAAEEGEGLDPVAAEAVRIAVEAICARVGANPKSMYALYATENFQSASSRKANTRFALEGVVEFLKELWAKIKAAIASLLDKATAFWNKHFSTLNRTQKALESMKAKVSASKGRPSNELVSVPSSLASIFPTKADLGIEEVKQFGGVADTAKVSNASIFKAAERVASGMRLSDVNGVVGLFKGDGTEFIIGTEKYPAPGGKYFKYTFKIEEEEDDGVKTFKLDVEEDHGEFTEGRKDAKLDIASKDKLKTLLIDTIDDVKAMVKYRDKVVQRNKRIRDAMKAVDKEIDGITDKKQQREARTAMRTYNLIMTKAPAMESKVLGLFVTYCRGVLSYTGLCLKNYVE